MKQQGNEFECLCDSWVLENLGTVGGEGCFMNAADPLLLMLLFFFDPAPGSAPSLRYSLR